MEVTVTLAEGVFRGVMGRKADCKVLESELKK